MMDLLIFGPVLSVLVVLTMVMDWIATLAVLATACATYSLEVTCLFAMFASLFGCFCMPALESAFLSLPF